MAETATYTYKPGSGSLKDKLRLMIPDRPVKDRDPRARFSDEELNDILSDEISGGALLESAAVACEIIAMDETKRTGFSVSINSGMSISRSGTHTFWLQRAQAIRKAALQDPWEYIDAVSYNIDDLGFDHSRYIGGVEISQSIDGWDGSCD